MTTEYQFDDPEKRKREWQDGERVKAAVESAKSSVAEVMTYALAKGDLQTVRKALDCLAEIDLLTVEVLRLVA